MTAFGATCTAAPGEIGRPERVVSKRVVVYDHEAYDRLATAWERYNDAFPSEDAYANWMYAARYAGREEYDGSSPASSTIGPTCESSTDRS